VTAHHEEQHHRFNENAAYVVGGAINGSGIFLKVFLVKFHDPCEAEPGHYVWQQAKGMWEQVPFAAAHG
jgi:hypothetical protein